MADINHVRKLVNHEAGKLTKEIRSSTKNRREIEEIYRQVKVQELEKREALSRLRDVQNLLAREGRPTQLRLDLGVQSNTPQPAAIDHRAARRVAKKLAKRHTPEERRGVRKFIAGVRDRLTSKRERPIELVVKGTVRETLNPARHRDLNRILELSQMEAKRQAEQIRSVDAKRSNSRQHQSGREL